MPYDDLAARLERRTRVFCALAALGLLWIFGRDGLWISFSEDDLMNLHFGFREPLGRLIAANLAPFTMVYRPAGSAFYLALFEVFGLEPIPYRFTAYGVLLLGCVGLYQLTKDLEGRPVAGALAVIPLAFHSRMIHLYSTGAYIYDSLCGMFFIATVWFYHRRRSQGELRAKDVAVLYLLWAATVNSKEIGLTLAVMLGAYELIFTRPLRWRDLVWPGVFFLLSIAAWQGKTAPGGPFAGHGSYQPGLDLAHVFREMRWQVADAIWANSVPLSPAKFALVAALFVGSAIAVRRKAALLGVAWTLITPLPVLAVVPSRPMTAYYVAWIGVCMVIGAVLAEALERLKVPANWQPLAVLALALVSARIHVIDTGKRPSIREFSEEGEHVQDAIEDYERLPGLCEARSVLVLESRFANLYHPLFLKELICNERDPYVAIVGVNIEREDALRRKDEFDLVLIDRGRDLEVVRSPLSF